VSTRYECRICWHVYDPAEGDDVWQIPPGTPFEDLPEDWTCPTCEAGKDKFIRLGEDDA
jgi:rubredoxin